MDSIVVQVAEEEKETSVSLKSNVKIKARSGSEYRLTESSEYDAVAPYSILYPRKTWIEWALAWCEDHNENFGHEVMWFICVHYRIRKGKQVKCGFIARRARSGEEQGSVPNAM